MSRVQEAHSSVKEPIQREAWVSRAKGRTLYLWVCVCFVTPFQEENRQFVETDENIEAYNFRLPRH